MVRQYYDEQVTSLSERELRSTFQSVEPPAALLGGWAVHLHASPGFESEHGRRYVGSRDIDVGVHVDPEWAEKQFEESPVERSLRRIEEDGYSRSRFGFVKHFHRDTGTPISEVKASDFPMHDVFQVFVDVVPDTRELDGFRETFGFNPPGEPLLRPVLDGDAGEPLASYVDRDLPGSVSIVPPELLAAMKIRSMPDRDKSHKRVKDVADLHALLWYVEEYAEITVAVLEHVSTSDLDRVAGVVDGPLYESAAALLQIDAGVVEDSITQLLRKRR